MPAMNPSYNEHPSTASHSRGVFVSASWGMGRVGRQARCNNQGPLASYQARPLWTRTAISLLVEFVGLWLDHNKAVSISISNNGEERKNLLQGWNIRSIFPAMDLEMVHQRMHVTLDA